MQTMTNEEILNILIVNPVFDQMTKYTSEDRPIYFSPNSGNSSLDGWVNQILIDSCVSAGYSVYYLTDSLNELGGLVEISNTVVNIDYQVADKKWVFFTKNYERNVNCSVHISIRDSIGKMMFSEEITNSYQDKLKKSEVKYIEDVSLPFTKGNLKNSNFGKKILEPVLITAATLTVVYLFYSLRSGN
jgi:hypothetical protein